MVEINIRGIDAWLCAVKDEYQKLAKSSNTEKDGCEFECLTRIENDYAACESSFRELANQISFKKIVRLKKSHLRLNWQPLFNKKPQRTNIVIAGSKMLTFCTL